MKSTSAPPSAVCRNFGRVFNLRLFIEGLKRLRVMTLAVGILTVASSALVPIVAAMERRNWAPAEYDVEVIKAFTVCIPLLFTIALSPFFFSVLFSFLHKRKESDFFHAIPYTRTCVYTSFVAAALVSVFIIQIIAATVAGILWAAVPYATFDVGAYIGYILADMLGAAMLSAFMMLALTVSGTGGSMIILFFLFASIVRIILAIFAGGLESIDIMTTGWLFEESFLSPMWFYPLSAMAATFTSTLYRDAFLFNPVCIVYSVLVTIALFILSGILYNRRRSEMAGNPAPGKRTQTFFRVLFTLPLSLLLTGLFMSDSGEDASVCLVIFVGALLCYFLYELITTKRARNMGAAVPGLGFVAAACIVFALVYMGTRTFIVTEDVPADRIASVEMDRGGLPSGIFQAIGTDALQIRDPEIIEIVAENYKKSQDEMGYRFGNGSNVVIRLKNGRVLRRHVMFDDEDLAAMTERLITLSEWEERFYTIPNKKDISHISVKVRFADSYFVTKHVDSGIGVEQEIYETFAAELSMLSLEQKKKIFEPQLTFAGDSKTESFGIYMEVEGFANSWNYGRSTDYYRDHFDNTYLITPDLPKTFNHLLNLWADEGAKELNSMGLTFGHISGSQSPYCTLSLYNTLHAVGDTNTAEIDKAQMADILQFLRERMVIVTKDVKPAADLYMLYLDEEYSNNEVHIAIRLHAEDLARLEEWFGIMEPLHKVLS